MKEMFELLFSVTLSSNVFIMAILLIRFLFKNSSKNSRLILWFLIGIKLILPFNIESKYSLLPSSFDTIIGEQESITTNIVAPQIESVGNSGNDWSVVCGLWAVGTSIILIYGVVSFWRLYKNTRDAIKMEDNIFQSEKIVSPFVLGVIKPKIYIPFNLDDETLSHIISHEKSHIKSFDNVTKLFAFILLAVHWFNPLVWVCFKLFTKDIELACDERVVKNYTLEKRKSYAEALLNCAVNEGKGLIHPLAFGEVSIKDRIKFVVSYKKSLKMVLVLFFIAVIVVTVCLGTVPKVSAKESAQNKIPVVEESTTEMYVEETTTEPVTEEVTEPTTEIAEYNAEYQETQPEFNLDDIDPEYREAFSIAQEEGVHVGEVMLRQSLEEQAEEYREMYNDYPKREVTTYPSVITQPEEFEFFPEPELPQTGFDLGSDKNNGVQRIPGLTAYSFP